MDNALRQQVIELENSTRDDAEQLYSRAATGSVRLDVEWLGSACLTLCQLVPGNSGLNALWGLGVNEAVTKEMVDTFTARVSELGITCSLHLAPVPGGDQVRRMLLERSFLPAGKFAMLRYADPRVWRMPEDESPIGVRHLVAGETTLFSRLNADGFGRSGPDVDISRTVIGRMSRANGVDAYLAWLGDEPMAQAMMISRPGSAGFYNASTLPRWRRLGAHTALIRRRLSEAVRNEAERIYARVPLGSQAQRNLERNGFEVAYISEQLVKPIAKQVEKAKEGKRKAIKLCVLSFELYAIQGAHLLCALFI